MKTNSFRPASTRFPARLRRHRYSLSFAPIKYLYWKSATKISFVQFPKLIAMLIILGMVSSASGGFHVGPVISGFCLASSLAHKTPTYNANVVSEEDIRELVNSMPAVQQMHELQRKIDEICTCSSRPLEMPSPLEIPPSLKVQPPLEMPTAESHTSPLPPLEMPLPLEIPPSLKTPTAEPASSAPSLPPSSPSQAVGSDFQLAQSSAHTSE